MWRQLDYRLGGDRAKFARYDLAGLVAVKRVDYTVAANWKIIQENFQECYHCATIHPELVDTLPQFRSLPCGVDATYETSGYHFAEDKASFSVSGDTILPRLPGLEDRDDRRYFGMVIRPNQQDFAASEWCQPNMRSRAYANGGVLVPTEQEIIGRWYYRWYRESMGL